MDFPGPLHPRPPKRQPVLFLSVDLCPPCVVSASRTQTEVSGPETYPFPHRWPTLAFCRGPNRLILKRDCSLSVLSRALEKKIKTKKKPPTTMSANDYYNQKPLPDATSAQYPGYYSGQPSSPYSSSTTPPPYSSQPHLAPGDRPSQGVSPSPFETVFDDHVYPASTHQSLQTPASSHQRLNQQDTGYHGASPTHSDDMAYNHPADDIPLRDQASRLHPKDSEMQDHVYDAPQPDRRRRARVRLGELGMLGSNRKRIPFVVYFFTLVQAAVFIGEIVKNGK